jgi:hypothetical protein
MPLHFENMGHIRWAMKKAAPMALIHTHGSSKSLVIHTYVLCWCRKWWPI